MVPTCFYSAIKSIWGDNFCILCVSVSTSSVGLQDCQNSINHKQGPIRSSCKYEAFVLALCFVMCLPIHLFNAFCGFQKYQKWFNQKNYLGKNHAITITYFCYWHFSIKRERIFHWITIFCHHWSYIDVCK